MIAKFEKGMEPRTFTDEDFNIPECADTLMELDEDAEYTKGMTKISLFYRFWFSNHATLC